MIARDERAALEMAIEKMRQCDRAVRANMEHDGTMTPESEAEMACREAVLQSILTALAAGARPGNLLSHRALETGYLTGQVARLIGATAEGTINTATTRLLQALIMGAADVPGDEVPPPEPQAQVGGVH